jgi:2-dehydropantoate 2-reductase
MHVVVVGAGCIGAWIGARLRAGGAQVTLVGRARLQSAVAAGGLEAETLTGDRVQWTLDQLPVSLDPGAVAGADAVIIAVKGGGTTATAESIREIIPAGVPVISLQNGLRNPDKLRSALPDNPVIAGMVSFNVVWDEGEDAGARFRQATSGPVVLARDAPPELVAALGSGGVDVVAVDDMPGVQWAKLILNLNNAVNALSGLPLRDELANRGYRRVLAAAMREAWAALRAAGIEPIPVGRMRPALAPRILPLPDWLFRVLAAPMIRIDPAARSSMADDLARNRPTEIGDINGEIVSLGARVGVPTPVNAHLVALVRQAELAADGSPALPPEALLPPA